MSKLEQSLAKINDAVAHRMEMMRINNQKEVAEITARARELRLEALELYAEEI